MKKHSVLGIISVTASILSFIYLFGIRISAFVLQDKYPPQTNLVDSIFITAIIYFLVGLITAMISMVNQNFKKTLPAISFCLIIVLIGGTLLINYIDKKPTTEEKIKKISEQIKQNPTNDSLYLERIILYGYHYNHNYDSLVALDLAKAESLGCKRALYYEIIAFDNFKPGGKNQLAADAFTILIERFGKKDYSLRGFCYMNMRRYESAIMDFTKMMEVDTSKDYNSEIAVCNELLGKYQQAIEYYQKAKKAENMIEYENYNISRCLILQGDYNKAVKFLNDSILSNNKYEILYRTRGMVYSKLKKYDSAIEDLKISIKHDSSSFVSEYFLSDVYAAIGDKSDALEHLHRAYIKGFGYSDILSRNINFHKYIHDPQFIKICSDYSKNSDTANFYLQQAISRGYRKSFKRN